MSPTKLDGLRLEVEEIESRGKPSCGTSSTSWLCTCIPLVKGPQAPFGDGDRS